MKHFLWLTVLVPAFVIAQKGAIKGNVFYKYNEYVGNRADAGCSVYLLYPKDSKHFKETKADLNGNFSFENLDTGRYLIVVKSQQVNQSPEEHIALFEKNMTIEYFGVDKSAVSENYFDSVFIYKKLYDSLANWLPAKKKQMKERDSRFYAVMDLYTKIPYTIDNFYSAHSKYEGYNILILELGSYDKVSFNEINLTTENPTTNIVVDFGTTYLKSSIN